MYGYRSRVDGVRRIMVVHQAETATDHRVAHLADGHRAGHGHGQRSRSSRSAPVNSSMVVRQSTRSTPCHSVIVWV